MKLKVILEAGADDFMAQLRQAKDEMSSKFVSMRDALDRADIAYLGRMFKRKVDKKGMTTSIPPESLDKFTSLGLADARGKLTPLARQFLQWNIKNPSQDAKAQDARNDSRTYRDQGWEKRRGKGYTDPRQDRALKIADNLSSDEENMVRNLFRRYFSKKSQNLVKKWGPVPQQVIDALNSKSKDAILTSNGEPTDFGEYFIIKFIKLDKAPNRFDLVGKQDPNKETNYGDASRRRAARLAKNTGKERLAKLNARTGGNY